MPQATRLGDTDTGHDACPPTALISASSNVLINGKGAGRKGDTYAPHGCNVHFINGCMAARIGDAVSCGGTVATGSPNVIIGG